jgi:ABC-type molybdate transport system substrate-binding protein
MTRLAALVLLLGLTAACSDTSTSPAATTTDTFSGTVSPGSPSMQTFTTSAAGTMTVTLTALTPQATVGLAVGTVSNSTCTPSGQASVQQGGTVSGSVSSSGTYCALVFDSGSLTAAESYTITVNHP